jgi:DnaK suppressor protein
MQEQDRQKLKQLIEQELDDVIQHIDKLKERSAPISPDNAIGRLSRMEAIGEQGVQQTALLAAQQRQQELKSALVRIDEDEHYGICEQCDESIPLARLMLMPESRFCVRCLQSVEE